MFRRFFIFLFIFVKLRKQGIDLSQHHIPVMRVRFLYTKKPREFNYSPRYYDPEKEAREKRRDELLGARPTSGEYVPGELIRSKVSARRESGVQGSGRKRQKSNTLKLVLALALIILIAYFLIR